MKAYKVVKRKRNGDRVSVLVPDWHPCYTVYMHQGKINTVNTGFAFKTYYDAKNWLSDQYDERCGIYCELKNGERLEVWSINCEEDEGYKDRIVDLSFFLNKSYFESLAYLRNKILSMKFFNKIIDCLLKESKTSSTKWGMYGSFIAKDIKLDSQKIASATSEANRPMPFIRDY